MTDDAATATADGSTAPDSGDAGANEDAYSGLLTAFPYAYRHSESRLFRAYVVVGGLIFALIVALFAIAVLVLVGNMSQTTGGTFTFSRAFFFVLMLLVVTPIVAPVLLVARRHRREGSSVAYDARMATAGCLFIVAVYVALAISTPEKWQQESAGAVGEFLYSLPAASAVVPPIVAVGVIYLAHRRYR